MLTHDRHQPITICNLSDSDDLKSLRNTIQVGLLNYRCTSTGLRFCGVVNMDEKSILKDSEDVLFYFYKHKL